MNGTDASANAGTVAVGTEHRFDEAALARWMTAHVEGYAGPLGVEKFKGGQSNPTYKLVTPQRNYVLRRKPPGPIVKGAHAVEREARVLAALGETGFPVARVHGLCTDDAVIGSWFYVMEMVEGRIFWDATFPDVAAADRPAYFDSMNAMNATIARLHGIDPSSVGLDDYGRPGNYFARQIARWSTQYRDDADAGRDPGMDRLVDRLPDHIPAGEESAIVHGDFRCDNLIFHYVAAYCHRTGREAMPDYDFYVAFNFFRLAAIFHGIKGGVLRGTASSAHARERAARLPRLTALACEAMAACR